MAFLKYSRERWESLVDFRVKSMVMGSEVSAKVKKVNWGQRIQKLGQESPMRGEHHPAGGQDRHREKGHRCSLQAVRKSRPESLPEPQRCGSTDVSKS